MRVRDLDRAPSGNFPIQNSLQWLRTLMRSPDIKWEPAQRLACEQALTEAEEVLSREFTMVGGMPVHPFIVKQHNGEEGPVIKGNGFDGLQVGKERHEAEEFVKWLNRHLTTRPQGQEARPG